MKTVNASHLSSIATAGNGSAALRMGAFWLAAVAMAVLFGASPLPVQAASPMTIFVREVNDPNTNLDDVFTTRQLKWRDDAADSGVRFLLYALPVVERVLPANQIFGREELTDDPFEPLPDARIAGEIRSALRRAMEEWNDLPTSGFSFQTTIPFAFDVATFDLNFPFGPDRVQMDNWNLITFDNPNVDFTEFDDDLNYATTVMFYASRDFDLTDNSNLGGIVRVIRIEQSNGDENETLVLDLDGDGVEDLRLERREYDAGEILDVDIVFNQVARFALWPESDNELGGVIPPTTVSNILGTPDIQVLTTRQLGYAIGGDSSLIPTSVMYNNFQSDNDFTVDPEDNPDDPNETEFQLNPFEARDLSQQLDVQVLAAILYPGSSSGTGTIEGRIFRGARLDAVAGAGVTGGTATVTGQELIAQKPVYVGRPIGPTPSVFQPNDILSNRGYIRLDANVLSGLTQTIPGSSTQSDLLFRLKGDYRIPGLPAATDYGVRIDAASGLNYLRGAPAIMSDVFSFFGNASVGAPEWYGGAGLTVAYSVDNPLPQVAAGTSAIATPFLAIQFTDNGGPSTSIPNAEIWTFPEDPLALSVRRADGTVTEFLLVDGEPGVSATSPTVDTINGTANFVYSVQGILIVSLEYRLVSLQGGTTPIDDALVTIRVTNLTAEDLVVGTRFRLSPVYGKPFQSQTSQFLLGSEPMFVNGTLVLAEQTLAPPPASFETWDNFSDARQIFSYFLTGAGLTTPSRLVFGSRFNIEATDTPYTFTPLGSVFHSNNGAAVRTFDSNALLYWDNRSLLGGQSLALTTAFGVTRYDRIPETGQPFDAVNPEFLDDDPLVSEPVSVTGGGITSGIDIITNDGGSVVPIPGTGTDGGTDPNNPDDPRPDDDPPIFDDGNRDGVVLPLDNLVVFGAGVGDFDNDGDLDVYLCIGARTDDPDNPQPSGGLANRIYRNLLKETGTLRFADITFGDDRLPGTADDFIPFQQDASYHASVGDFDLDGFVDIYVSNIAAPAGLTISGRQNRILMNRERTRGGVTERYFVDGTEDFDPGILNIGANQAFVGNFPGTRFRFEGNQQFGFAAFDISTRSAIGDIDSDGDLDIVVSNASANTDAVGSTGIWGPTLLDTDPGPDAINLFWSERILINTLIDKDPARHGQFRFVDETLGIDSTFGLLGRGPLTDYELVRGDDRLPPLYPNIPTNDGPPFDQGNNEQDISDSTVVLLAPLDTVGAALDIFIGNRRPTGRTITNGFPDNTSTNFGINMIYQNIDIDEDNIPDGYYGNITGGVDYALEIGPDGEEIEVSKVILPGVLDRFPQGNPIPTFYGLVGTLDGDSDDSADPERNLLEEQNRTTSHAFAFDAEGRGINSILMVDMLDDGTSPSLSRLNAQGFYARGRNGGVGGTSTEYVLDTNAFYFAYASAPTFSYSPYDGQGRPRTGAAADFNLDGDFDFLVAGDSPVAIGPYVIFNEAPRGSIQLFLNGSRGYGDFENGSADSTFADVDQLAPWFYLHAADFDNDGDDDLLALNLGDGVTIYRNLTISSNANVLSGADFPTFFDTTTKYISPFSGTNFTPEPEAGGLNITSGVDLADATGNGLPDVAVSRGAALGTTGDLNSMHINAGAPLYNSGQRVLKTSYGAAPGARLRNDFDELTVASNAVLQASTWVRMADLDNDGAPDIYVSNYGTGSQIFFNVDSDDLAENSQPDADDFPDGVFVERTSDRIPDFSLQPLAQLTQHFAYADVNGDGRIDIVTGNGPNAPNRLLINNQPPFEPNSIAGAFSDATSGNMPSLSDDTVHIVASDFDSDGDIDLFILNRYRTTLVGGVEVETSPHSRLYLNNGAGVFTDVTWGDDGVPFTSDDRIPAIFGNVSSALSGDFDLAGDITEDLNGNGILEINEREFLNADRIIDVRIRPEAGDPVPPPVFKASFDLFITRTDGQNLLLLNNGAGFFTFGTGLPAIDDESYAADMGNVTLRTRRDLVHDPADSASFIEVDRPLIDILVGNRSVPFLSNSLSFLVSDAAAPGSFINRSSEFPIVTSVLFDFGGTPPLVVPDNINGNFRAVRFADLDGDGDLDVYLGQGGSFAGQVTGATDVIFTNRLIGDNLLAQTLRGDSPGVPPQPRVRSVQPDVARPGTDIYVFLHGRNFTAGALADFGPGTQVLEYTAVQPNVIGLRLRIASNAALGARTVKVSLPNGLEAVGNNIFIINSSGSGSTPALIWEQFE